MKIYLVFKDTWYFPTATGGYIVDNVYTTEAAAVKRLEKLQKLVDEEPDLELREYRQDPYIISKTLKGDLLKFFVKYATKQARKKGLIAPDQQFTAVKKSK